MVDAQLEHLQKFASALPVSHLYSPAAQLGGLQKLKISEFQSPISPNSSTETEGHQPGNRCPDMPLLKSPLPVALASLLLFSACPLLNLGDKEADPSAPPPLLQEREPNDERGTAMHIAAAAVVEGGFRAPGKAGEKADVDWYKLQAEPLKILKVSFESRNADSDPLGAEGAEGKGEKASESGEKEQDSAAENGAKKADSEGSAAPKSEKPAASAKNSKPTGNESKTDKAAPPTEALLEFFDADLLPLFSQKSSQGVATIPNLLCEKACYLKLSPAAPSDTKEQLYRLEFAFEDLSPRSEREPNDNAKQAQNLGLGKVVDAYLGTASDQDWFALDPRELAPGELFSISLTPPPQLRVELSVANQGGEIQGSWQSEAPGQALRLRNLAPLGQERFFLLVQGAKGAKGEAREHDANTPYSLEVRSSPALANGEVEPNNLPERANLLELSGGQDSGTSGNSWGSRGVGESAETKGSAGLGGAGDSGGFGDLDEGQVRSASISGHLAPAGDVDWYKVKIPSPSVLRAELSAVNGLDLAMTLRSEASSGPAPKEVRVDDRGSDEGEVLGGMLVPEGWVWIRVDEGNSPGSARSNASQAYRLSVELRPDDGSHEREPNDQLRSATPIRPGQEIQGFIHPAGDVDIYRLEVEEELDAVLNLSAVPGLDLSLRIRDGATGSGHPVIGSADQGKAETSERLVIPLQAGSYYVEVRAADKASNPRHSYRLSVK